MKVGIQDDYFFQRGGKVNFEQWHVREGNSGDGPALCSVHVTGRAIFGWAGVGNEEICPDCYQIAERKGILILT